MALLQPLMLWLRLEQETLWRGLLLLQALDLQ